MILFNQSLKIYILFILNMLASCVTLSMYIIRFQKQNYYLSIIYWKYWAF